MTDNHLRNESYKARLKLLFRSAFNNFSPHHIIPSSRGGSSDQYNLFPWKQKPHQAWHFIFFNMTINEVWEKLPYIHSKIFYSVMERITRDWIFVCTVNTDNTDKLAKFNKDRQSLMQKKDKIIKFEDEWIRCFGDDSLERAELVIKYTMLFMIFGEAMADPEKNIFDNGHLEKLLTKIPNSGMRRWAFEQCLSGQSLRNAKAKIGVIIDKIRYSP